MVSSDEKFSTNEDGSIKTAAVRWLFGQEANTVALYLILAAMGYGAWWSVTVGVPKHLDSIKQGYREVATEHKEAVRILVEDKDRTLDRIERYKGMEPFPPKK